MRSIVGCTGSKDWYFYYFNGRHVLHTKNDTHKISKFHFMLRGNINSGVGHVFKIGLITNFMGMFKSWKLFEKSKKKTIICKPTLKKYIAKLLLSPHHEYLLHLLKICPMHLLKFLQEKEFSTPWFSLLKDFLPNTWTIYKFTESFSPELHNELILTLV